MAKKQKVQAEPTAATTVPSKDVLQRLSYLYQASVLLANVLPHQPQHRLIPTQPDLGEGTSSQGAATTQLDRAPQQPSKTTKLHKSSKKEAAAKPVSRLLVKTMSEVAKKATLRMDPTVKRTMCKGCSAVLVAGVTSTVRIKPSGPHAHMVVHTCRNCNARRRIPAPPHLPDEPEPTKEQMEVKEEPGSDLKAPDEPKLTKRERRERRQARRPVFFERKGHLTFAGSEQVVKE